MEAEPSVTPGAASRDFQPSRWDVVAIPLVLSVVMLLALGAREMTGPFHVGEPLPISLDPANLPGYALRTTVRMLIALAASLVFSVSYATLAAKSRRAEQILIPVLDVLQSVPVLGYISFTVTGFLALFPGSLLGAEMAAIFAIFTSQAWNMTFSMHQSLRAVPHDLHEAAAVFGLTSWQKFWRLEMPYAMPGLVWNAMMSMSGGWFFVVASESISLGDEKIALPGIGSYIALAIERRDLTAVGWAIATMLLVLVCYDQLLFRPLVAWAERFKVEETPGETVPQSWILDLFRRARLLRFVGSPLALLLRLARDLRLLGIYRPEAGLNEERQPGVLTRMGDLLWYLLLGGVALLASWRIYQFLAVQLTLSEILHVLLLGLTTALRVMVCILLAAIIWVPIGVHIGLRPRLAQFFQPVAQFLAAFPANLLFPPAVIIILRYQLDPNVWLTPLMILGTQWYLLFNVIAGASAFPQNLRDAAAEFHVRGWLWWRKVMMPSLAPYLLTGAITAAGGCWNASIVAEAVSWGDDRIGAFGLGAYIADATLAGDFAKIALGIGVMSLYVALSNRLIWRPLYALAEKRAQLR